jgi:hypothetical protein
MFFHIGGALTDLGNVGVRLITAIADVPTDGRQFCFDNVQYLRRRAKEALALVV